MVPGADARTAGTGSRFQKGSRKMADVLRPKDLMKILGVCRAKAYQLIQEPGFPAHKIGPKEVII